MRNFVVTICIATCLLETIDFAQSVELSSLETKDLRLVYLNPAQTYLVPHTARSFENSMLGQRSLFAYEPYEKVTVFLMDFADLGNAWAFPLPTNTLLVEISPRAPAFETSESGERIYSLMNHELVHLVTTEQANLEDRRYRRMFGGKVLTESQHPETILYSYLTNPRVHAPRWYHEGIAVFVQTWMAGGLGRAQGAYDEMVFRSMVRDGAHFYDPLGLAAVGTEVDFQVGVNAYLYGTRFMTYLAYEYSPDKLIEWVTRTDGSERYYASQFRKVFGLPLEFAWRDWISWEHEFQQANLESVRQFPGTPYRDISNRTLGSVSRAFLSPEGGKLFAAFRYPGVVSHIGAISLEDGSIEKIVDVKGPMHFKVTSLAFDPDAGILFYTADNDKYRDLMAVNTTTGESSMLMKDARIGELVFNRKDGSLWGVRHLSGIATLVRIPRPYNEWKQIRSLPMGEIMFDLDVSPDGDLLSASFGDISGNQTVQVMKTATLLDGDTTPVAKFDMGQAVPESFVFSRDGKYLYGSSFYTGVSNIFRYELETGELEAVSNAETGFFRPLQNPDGSLTIFHYTGQGFVPAIIQPEPLQDVGAITFLGAEVIKRHPELKSWRVGSPADIPLEELITFEGDYSPIRHMGLNSIVPIVEGYKDSVGIGFDVNFGDPLRLDLLDIAVSYSPDKDLAGDERAHFDASYRHVSTSGSPLSGTWTAGLRYNYADFYDLFGPTKKGLKGQSGNLGYKKILIFDEPRLMHFSVDLWHYRDLERLPDFQNVDTPFDKLTTLQTRLEFSNLKSSLGSVDDEKGYAWELTAIADHANSETIPKLYGIFDFGFALPWKHSSIWLRNSAGLADGDRDNAFANFFFGGFGNNYVDRGTEKRYREEYSLPGFELNEIGGRSFYRSMLEWNLPPIRFENLGTPGFYVSWARSSLFATSLVVDPDAARFRRTVSDVGAQIDFRFHILSRLDMTLSLGYAIGTGEAVRSADEFMISLKVL